MDDEKLKKVIKELDESVPKEGAVVNFEMYGGGADESFVEANKKGYLRLGIEFLKAAFAPITDEKKKAIDLDIKYLTSDEASVRFDWFERKEELTAKKMVDKPGGFKDAVSLLGCAIIFFIALFVFIMGIFGTISMFKDIMK